MDSSGSFGVMLLTDCKNGLVRSGGLRERPRLAIRRITLVSRLVM
jgi:hypothetical protein